MRRLERAASELVPCRPVRDLLAAAGIDAAYQVQHALIARRTAVGARIGPQDRPHLAGSAAAARRRPARLRRPARRHGRPRAASSRPDGCCSRRSRPRSPSCWAPTWPAGPSDADAVRAAVAIRARRRWRSSTAASPTGTSPSSTRWPTTRPAGCSCCGERGSPLSEVDPVAIAMTMRRNGEVASTGDGAPASETRSTRSPGSPRTAARYGDPLRAGEVVSPARSARWSPAPPGDQFARRPQPARPGRRATFSRKARP